MVRKPLFRFESYDPAKYPFAEVLSRDVFHLRDLSKYHELFLQDKNGQLQKPRITHQDNMSARELLKTMDKSSEFYQLYHAFLREVLAPLFPAAVHFIAPVYRVHMAGSTSISGWHRDVDVTRHSDLITAWIPFVDTAESNTLWVETEYGKQDYVPIPVKYGQIFLFDSAWLWHGSVTNQTDITRVSMDVRMIPLHKEVKGYDLGVFAARPEWCKDENVAVKDKQSPSMYEQAHQ